MLSRRIAALGLGIAMGACGPLGIDLAVEPASIEIPVGDLVFDALADGPADGELVLLLHGFPQTSYAFRHQVHSLAAAGYRAVAPDQRGYSPRARPAEHTAYAMRNLVADVIGMADALGADRFHLVGHDWGGAVAWVVAGSFPDRVRTLTVLSTPHVAALGAARSDPDSDQSKRSAYFSVFSQEGAEARFLENDAAFLRSIYGGALDDYTIGRYVEALGTPQAMRAALAWYRAAFGTLPAAASASATAAPPAPPGPIIRVPTLYVWSTEDSAFGRAPAEDTASYVTGPYRFEILEGHGHWIPESAADQVSRWLVEHVQSAARQSMLDTRRRSPASE